MQAINEMRGSSVEKAWRGLDWPQVLNLVSLFPPNLLIMHSIDAIPNAILGRVYAV